MQFTICIQIAHLIQSNQDALLCNQMQEKGIKTFWLTYIQPVKIAHSCHLLGVRNKLSCPPFLNYVCLGICTMHLPIVMELVMIDFHTNRKYSPISTDHNNNKGNKARRVRLKLAFSLNKNYKVLLMLPWDL